MTDALSQYKNRDLEFEIVFRLHKLLDTSSPEALAEVYWILSDLRSRITTDLHRIKDVLLAEAENKQLEFFTVPDRGKLLVQTVSVKVFEEGKFKMQYARMAELFTKVVQYKKLVKDFGANPDEKKSPSS